MTWFLIVTSLGLVIIYIYQIKISKSQSILSVNKEGVFFSRKSLKVKFKQEIVFAASDSNLESPPSDAEDLDFLLDKKESFLFVWRNGVKIAKVRTTFMNLDSRMIAALLNDINQEEMINRNKVIESFHTIITEKASTSIKECVLINEL